MRIPSLIGLRAFEATARHLSMKHAAEELCVTPSAVSQLLKSLETELGISLFRRDHRAIALTEAGQTLLPPVRNAFRLLTDASDKVRSDPDGGVLTVSVTAFFAETWLIPQLGHFRALHPNIDLRISATTSLANLTTGEADVAIRHGLGSYRGMSSDLLLAPPVVPVAAPSLVKRQGRPECAAALIDWPKIHDADRGGWAMWFASQGVPDPGSTKGPSFDDPGLLRASVQAGLGVGLLPAPLIAPCIADGTLVAVGTEALIEEFAYYLVVPRTNLSRTNIAAFRAWAVQSGEALSAGRRSDLQTPQR
jgi:LysR family transcriptional regulator, glycine cleavage system transcriptional activator